MIHQHNPCVTVLVDLVLGKDKLGNVEKQPGNVGKSPSSVKPSLIHNSVTELRNRYTESLQLGLILTGDFGYSPLVIQSDDALTT